MRRVIMACFIVVAPVLTILAASGCEQEVKSVQKSERVEQSEPKMTSPGKEVVE
jgi:hypothetical protein